MLSKEVLKSNFRQYGQMEKLKSMSGKSHGREEQKREDQSRERVRRKKMQALEKVATSRNVVFFQWFCGSGGSKSRLAKAAGAEPCGQMRDEKLHAVVVARSKFFGSQKCENSPVQSTFGSWDVQKVHAVVARSTSRSQNVQSTSVSDHFWKFRCRKSARRGRAKHVCKSKVLKTEGLGALLQVEMLKKCTPLWREAHFEVKMYKAHHVQSTFGSWDVQKVTPLWREARFEVKIYKAPQPSTAFGSSEVKSVKNWRSRSTFWV